MCKCNSCICSVCIARFACLLCSDETLCGGPLLSCDDFGLEFEDEPSFTSEYKLPEDELPFSDV